MESSPSHRLFWPFPRKLEEGRFVRRYKRFFCDVVGVSKGQPEDILTVHCANSGSMKSCLEENAPALILDSQNPKRKLSHSLEGLRLQDGWACLNTVRANHLFTHLMANREFMKSEEKKGSAAGSEPLDWSLFLQDFGRGNFKPEAKFGSKTRFDGLLVQSTDPGESMEQRTWIELKSVSLRESPDLVSFPDAVTARGAKHLLELSSACDSGDRAVMVFVITRGGDVPAADLAAQFAIAGKIDPHYQACVHEAASRGVLFRILVMDFQPWGIGCRGYFPWSPG